MWRPSSARPGGSPRGLVVGCPLAWGVEVENRSLFMCSFVEPRMSAPGEGAAVFMHPNFLRREMETLDPHGPSLLGMVLSTSCDGIRGGCMSTEASERPRAGSALRARPARGRCAVTIR